MNEQLPLNFDAPLDPESLQKNLYESMSVTELKRLYEEILASEAGVPGSGETNVDYSLLRKQVTEEISRRHEEQFGVLTPGVPRSPEIEITDLLNPEQGRIRIEKAEKEVANNTATDKEELTEQYKSLYKFRK